MKAQLSQKQLGILAGIDEFSASSRVNQYEVGKHHPDLTTVYKLAEVLGVPVAYFYADDDQLAEIVALFPKLTKRTKSEVMKAIISSLDK